MVVVLVAAACAPGVPPLSGSFVDSLTTRSVSVSVTGSTSYSEVNAPAVALGDPAGFSISYDGSSNVVAVNGAISFETMTDDVATVTLSLRADALGVSGRVSVSDPATGVNVSANGVVNGFSVDDLGNVSGSVTAGSRTISFATSSVVLPAGTDPALEALVAAQEEFCQDAQQRLAGLDPLEVPLGSILNTREPNRPQFTASKAELSPLTTRTWTDTVDVTTEAGAHATIAQRISCKTRANDHVATTGVATGGSPAACSVLNQRSIDLALEQMTPAQAAAVNPPTLGPDVVRQTGAQWNTPLSASTEFSGNTLRAHSLLTGWNDPAFALFPDTIRGVHYCTVWSPAYAYTYLLSTTLAVF